MPKSKHSGKSRQGHISWRSQPQVGRCRPRASIPLLLRGLLLPPQYSLNLNLHAGGIAGVHFRFSQAEMCNGLKSVGTICYRADGSRSSAFQSRLGHIFLRGISISCKKLKCARSQRRKIFLFFVAGFF